MSGVRENDLEDGPQCGGRGGGGSGGGTSTKTFTPRLDASIPNVQQNLIRTLLTDFEVWDKVKIKFPNGNHTIVFKADSTVAYAGVREDARFTVLLNLNVWNTANYSAGELASTLAHELVHVGDHKRGVNPQNDLATYQSEVDAYALELRYSLNDFKQSARYIEWLGDQREKFQICVHDGVVIGYCTRGAGANRAAPPR